MDEEFKISMGLYLGRRAPSFWQGALKTLNHETKKRHKKKLLDEISPILTRLMDGRWGYRIPINREPIIRVVTKIVRGLHWRETGEILPANTDITITLIRQDEQLQPEVKSLLNAHGKWIEVGAGSFQAQYAIVVDRKHASLWLLRFYNEDCFGVVVLPENKMRPKKH